MHDHELMRVCYRLGKLSLLYDCRYVYPSEKEAALAFEDSENRQNLLEMTQIPGQVKEKDGRFIAELRGEWMLNGKATSCISRVGCVIIKFFFSGYIERRKVRKLMQAAEARALDWKPTIELAEQVQGNPSFKKLTIGLRYPKFGRK